MFNTLGHVPTEGEHLVSHGWRFTVREMEGRRIKRVEITREPEIADDGELVDADR
ncbi:MAG: transporter associated domain-containing protein [Ilumatobacteraceae bacterium]